MMMKTMMKTMMKVSSFSAVCLFLTVWFISQPAAGSIIRTMSEPLHSVETYRAVQDVSRHAQDSETDGDTSVRLLPKAETDQNHVEICCLHANILDFYLHNILHNRDHLHPSMHQLKANLARVSTDLQGQGCLVSRYHDHRHAVQFRKKLKEMGGQGLNKAVGEIDILFTYLRDYCFTQNHRT